MCGVRSQGDGVAEGVGVREDKFTVNRGGVNFLCCGVDVGLGGEVSW